MANRRPVMLVGNAGSGKTVLINNKLASLDGDETLVTTIPLNYYTNSLMLQQVSADKNCFIFDVSLPIGWYLYRAMLEKGCFIQIG
jgi:Ni2+-binding GTPase involved in maturation of urease and hydrogenase